MAKFSDSFVSWVLLGLFVVSMIAFTIGIQEKNGLESTIGNDSIINSSYVSLTNTLSESTDTANSSKTAFESDIEPQTSFGDLVFVSILGVGKTITGMIIGVYNILFVLPTTKLGIPKLITNVLSTLIIMTLVLMAWRVYRSGD